MTDETAVKNTAVVVIPCILECGYEQVWIEKSGKTFPAWKVSLETGVWWRSKLDFLLLSRQSSVPLPKAAFQKLAEESPWQRPNSHQSVEQHTVNHWKPQMRKSLFLFDQFLITAQKNNLQAWSRFCRPTDTKNLYTNTTMERVDNSQSKQWGQYFCSNDNAKQLVRIFMELLREQNNRDWLIIEPSCGHGIILRAFAENRQKQEDARWKIVGMDIDPKAISYCRNDHSLSPSMKQIHWVVADFLNSRKHDFGVEESGNCAVIGNPPFHLAGVFVKHAITEYKASAIVFIMPRRLCSDKDSSWEHGRDYECKHVPLESCDFHFQGDPSQTIKQPSSIQCLWKRK